MTDIKSSNDGSFARFLVFMICVLFLLVLFVSFNRFFAHDEFEHIHSAWYVSNGYAPYSDFFQNHHPLLWILIIPFFSVFGQTTMAILAIRFFMLVFTIGTVFLVYRISRLFTPTREIGLFSVLFLLSMVLYVEKGIEVRPDVPQVFFGILSFYWLVKFLKSRRNINLILSGFALSISFLFLQKAVFLLLIYLCFFIFSLIKGKIPLLSVLSFFVSSAIPVILFLGYLLLSGSFQDYLLCNWTIHIKHLVSFSPFSFLALSFLQNTLFWVFSVLSVGLLLSRKAKNYEWSLVMFFGLFSFFLVFFVKHPYRQYFLLPIVLMSLTNAYTLNYLFLKFNWHQRRKIQFCSIIFIVPFVILVFSAFPSNIPQLKKIDYVLKNSEKTELVYDGDNRFNVFRKDLHYFWYSVKNRGLDTYNMLTNNKYEDYDICRLIQTKKPKIISDFRLDLKTCGLDMVYEATEFKGLYIRVERQ